MQGQLNETKDLTNSSRKRREEIEGGCGAEQGRVNTVDWDNAANIGRPCYPIPTESTLVRSVVSGRRQTLHRQSYLQQVPYRY